MSVGAQDEEEEDVLEVVVEMEVDVDGETVGGDVGLLRAW